MKHNDVGKLGEDIASNFLKKNGFTVIERNIHFSHNEIDIIAKDKEFIIFVEVKARAKNSFYLPREAVTLAKQRRIVKTAMLFLQQHRKQHRFSEVTAQP